MEEEADPASLDTHFSVETDALGDQAPLQSARPNHKFTPFHGSAIACLVGWIGLGSLAIAALFISSWSFFWLGLMFSLLLFLAYVALVIASTKRLCCCGGIFVTVLLLLALLCFLLDAIALRDSPHCPTATDGLGESGICRLPGGNGTGHLFQTFGKIYPICVETISYPSTVAEFQGLAVKLASFTAAGTKHSGGGQVAAIGGNVLDMRRHWRSARPDQYELDVKARTIIVRSGTTWKEVEEIINPHRLALITRQASPDFSVGGSISANAHGVNWDTGTSVMDGVIYFELMNADGKIQTVHKGDQLFNLVIGGYGLFGVILNVKLQLQINDTLNKTCHVADYTFAEMQQLWLEKAAQVKENGRNPGSLAMFNVHYFSMGKHSSFMREAIVCEGGLSMDLNESHKPLQVLGSLALSFVQDRALRWWRAYPRWTYKIGWIFFQNDLPSKSGKPESRTNFVRDDYSQVLDDCSTSASDILDEYFVPIEHLASFLEVVYDTLSSTSNLNNIALRPSGPSESFLNRCTPLDSGFCVAVVFQGRLQHKGKAAWMNQAEKLAKFVAGMGGTYNLVYVPRPYHILSAAFPQIEKFVTLAQSYDKKGRFHSLWWSSIVANSSVVGGTHDSARKDK